MPAILANRPYRWMAEYFDYMFTFHLSWFEAARQRILGPILPRIESACDLACGTGTTALALARRGIRMFAVDLSPAMCRAAREKARRTGLPVRVFRSDMREFRLPRPVDLITCEFDAINHVPRKADLSRVARAVARALRPGGYFYFDTNNRPAFANTWPGAMWFERPPVAVVIHGGYEPRRDRDRAWTDVEWFVRGGRHWQRHHEHFEEVCWSPSEIRRTLRGSGFGPLRAWDAVPFMKTDPNIRPGYRTFYLAQLES